MKTWQIIFLLFLVAGSIYVITRNTPYKSNSGKVFGTYYNIIYQSNDDLHETIKAAMMRVDNSLSTFNKQSTITAINNGEDITPDSTFVKVFTLAQEISAQTGGTFDITVAPLVNAWGFGFKKGFPADSLTIDSLRRLVGYTTLDYRDGRIVKQHPQTMLDCSAIAKGYGCDMVARMFDRRNITDYMIEIGGEVVTKGKNDRGTEWNISISKPTENTTGSHNAHQRIVAISGKAMATSGNYRNFRIENGKKYAHTIDPRTGYPVQHSLLSATVIAENCAKADAYATSFMVMGLEKAIDQCKKDSIEAFFIYSNGDGALQTYATEGF